MNTWKIYLTTNLLQNNKSILICPKYFENVELWGAIFTLIIYSPVQSNCEINALARLFDIKTKILLAKHHLVSCKIQWSLEDVTFIISPRISYHLALFVFELVCPEGNFGRGCLEECGSCINDTCHHVNGTCSGPCQDGLVGKRCVLAKGKPQYSTFCTERCYLHTLKMGRQALRGRAVYNIVHFSS